MLDSMFNLSYSACALIVFGSTTRYSSPWTPVTTFRTSLASLCSWTHSSPPACPPACAGLGSPDQSGRTQSPYTLCWTLTWPCLLPPGAVTTPPVKKDINSICLHISTLGFSELWLTNLSLCSHSPHVWEPL